MARSGTAEDEVIEAAVARGYLTHQQLAEARGLHARLAAQGPVELLPVVARYLAPAQRDALRAVYLEAQRRRAVEEGAPRPADDEESTQLLDRPLALPEPPGAATRGGAAPRALVGATAAGPGAGGTAPGPAAATAFGATPAPTVGPQPVRLAAPGPAGPASAGPPADSPAPLARTVAVPAAAAPAPPAAEAGLAATVAAGPPTGSLASAADARRKAPAGPPRVRGYTLLRELGRGGMGVVWAARDEGLDRLVALKVLLRGQGASDEDVQRFQLEARATARLKHPGIVQVLGQGRDEDDDPFIVMELIEGESLEARVRREGPLPPREAAEITLALARALEHAHGQSILHRDLKPHNVLLDRDGTPKLTDFGLAKLTDGSAATLTASGPGILGTPSYMPPEQAGGERRSIDARSDVYGLGATLYHLLTGHAPFEGESLATVVVAVIQRPPAPPSLRLGQRLPRDLETICLKCLEKAQADRYPSAAALAADLEAYLAHEEIAARPVATSVQAARWARANRPAAAAVGAAGLLTLVSLGWGAQQALEARRLAASLGASDGMAADVPPTPQPGDATHQTPPPVEPPPAEPQPAPVEPKPVEPKPVEPAPAEPAPAEPRPAEPRPAEPTPAEPRPAEPTPAEPRPAEPTPAEPTPAEPRPAEPTPAEPTPAEPTPAPVAARPEATPTPAPPAPDPATPDAATLDAARRLADAARAHRLDALRTYLREAPRGASPPPLAGWRSEADAARDEARLRGLPLVVVVADKATALPGELTAWAEARRDGRLGVLLLLRDVSDNSSRNGPHARGIACPVHPPLRCDDHIAVWDALKKKERLVGHLRSRSKKEGDERKLDPSDGEVFVAVCDAEFERLFGAWSHGGKADLPPLSSQLPLLERACAEARAALADDAPFASPAADDLLLAFARAAEALCDPSASTAAHKALDDALDVVDGALRAPDPRLAVLARALGRPLRADLDAQLAALKQGTTARRRLSRLIDSHPCLEAQPAR